MYYYSDQKGISVSKYMYENESSNGNQKDKFKYLVFFPLPFLFFLSIFKNYFG